jgi:hypothetical protein
LNRTLALERPNTLAWLLMAAALAVPGFGGTPTMVGFSLTRPGALAMADKPKPTKGTYHDSVGPIPADNWDNDLPYNPKVDLTDYADLEKELDAELAKNKPKK